MNLRRIAVVREVEISMEELKSGEVFRVKGDPLVDESMWFLATGEPEPCEPEGNWMTPASSVDALYCKVLLTVFLNSK